MDKSFQTVLLRVMEEEADSSLKLVLCGSQISTMDELFAERNPLHDRLRRFYLEPMTLWKSLGLIAPGTAEERLAAFSWRPTVAGRYYLRLTSPPRRTKAHRRDDGVRSARRGGGGVGASA